MLSRRSNWSSVILSSAVMAAASFFAPTLWAEEAAPAPAATAAPAVDNKLKTLADDFLHYSIVGNEQLAKDNGQALLNANADPKDFLAAFEAAAGDRDFRAQLLRNERNENLKEISAKLLDKVEEGYRATIRDPQRIKTEIERLDNNQRAYMIAKERLTAAGPYAVPYYLQYLQDTKKKELTPYILRVMVDVGRPLLPPLIEQLNTGDATEKITIIQVLANIGYPQSLPYLKAIAANPNVGADVQRTAKDAIARIDAKGQMTNVTPADAFLSLSQSYFQKKPSVGPQNPKDPTNPIWFYDKGLNNVTPIPVPTSVWYDIQAMRAAETTLKLEPNKAQAISLWIAADLRREINLNGAKDPTMPENAPSATYYAVAAGPVYLNPVLQLALHDRDTALALKAIQVLEATGGTQGLVDAKEGQSPLVKAMGYPDRAVRFNAAFALARGNPAKEFNGSFRVMPVLAEAISQTGQPVAILVDANQDNRNRIKSILVAKGYNVFDGSSLSAALENTRRAGAFELVIVPASDTARIQELAQTDYRLTAAPVLVTAPKANIPAVRADLANAAVKGIRELDQAAEEAVITEALASLRTDISQTPIDAAAATNYAQTALKLLGTLVADHASIYNMADVQPTLIETLKDKRPEILTAAASVLSQLNNAEAQKALAAVALGDNSDNAVRVALFNSLAESAKRAGNQLDAATISQLIKVVSTPELDANVKTAAATALGALNVPSNQASTLILQQAK